MITVSQTYNPKNKKTRKQLKDRKLAEQLAKKEKSAWKGISSTSQQPKYRPERNTHLSIQSGPSVKPHASNSEKIEYSDEMQEREARAREEIERKKQCVAPAYNKGAYQYIGSEEQAKWIGKK